jgi:hypothetical protein
MGILRQAKNPVQSKPLIIQYQYARKTIAACLQSPVEANRIIGASIAALEQKRDDMSSSPLIRDDADRSIDVINMFQRSVNALQLDGYRFSVATNQNGLIDVSGVEISVYPDAIAYAPARGGDMRVGAVFLKCTLGLTGDSAESRRTEANLHLATIAHMFALETLASMGTPHAPSSMVIDITRQTMARGPVNIKKRVDNIRAACDMIAAVWPRV